MTTRSGSRWLPLILTLVILWAAGLVIAAYLVGKRDGRDAATATQTAPAITVTPTVTAEPVAPDQSEQLRAAFGATQTAQPWFADIDSIRMDGTAVIVVARLLPDDVTTARLICDATWQVATEAAIDFGAVTVRTVGDKSLATRARITAGVACE